MNNLRHLITLDSIQLRVKNRSDRLKRLIALKAPEIIIDREKVLLQEAFAMFWPHLETEPLTPEQLQKVREEAKYDRPEEEEEDDDFGPGK